MLQTKRNIRICVVLMILNVLFIWGNSLLPADISVAFSRYVKKILVYILSLEDSTSDTSHGLLRKIAHFAEFASLGALLAWLYTMLQHRNIFLLLSGVLIAGGDEFIQRFVPGRGPSLVDVLIDSSGVLFGICAVLVLYMLVSKRKQQSKFERK